MERYKGISFAESGSAAKRSLAWVRMGRLLSPASLGNSLVVAFLKRERLVMGLSLAAFIWAIVASRVIFPFYTNNHDEPVYVLQAEALLQGKLYLSADEYTDFFLGWFTKRDGDRVFFKYTPVHAAFLALGKVLLGSQRAALGLIAAGNIILFYLLALEMLRERRLAVAAAVCLALSPFFLTQSATFLSYLSSLLLNLAFALLLLRGSTRNSPLLLFLSGVTLGLAFFARPFDALLFAVPFGILFLARGWGQIQQLIKNVAWVGIGVFPVLGLTAAYNSYITGNPLLFPFAFYEPLDVLGFGPRRMTSSADILNYTFPMAVQTLRRNLAELNLWVFGGPLLILLAFLRGWISSLHGRDWVLLLLFLIFPLGYFFFWGPYNLSFIWVGLILFGPFYYIPLLVPLILFGVQTLAYLWRWKRHLAIVVVCLMLLLDAWLVGSSIQHNLRYTEEAKQIYRPFLEHRIGNNALVFVPPLYGEFLLHPFPYLANSPSLTGPVLYSLNRGAQNLSLLDRYPERTPYLFVYRGLYTERPDDNINTDLVPLKRVGVSEFVQRLRVTNPSDSPYVYTYIWNDGVTQTYLIDDASKLGFEYNITWRITAEGAHLDGSYKRQESQLGALSSKQFLAVAVAFSKTVDRSQQAIYERRFWLRAAPGNQLEVVLPGEEWYTPSWNYAPWIMQDITQVLSDG